MSLVNTMKISNTAETQAMVAQRPIAAEFRPGIFFEGIREKLRTLHEIVCFFNEITIFFAALSISLV